LSVVETIYLREKNCSLSVVEGSSQKYKLDADYRNSIKEAITAEEALFMLASCSEFINYLNNKKI